VRQSQERPRPPRPAAVADQGNFRYFIEKALGDALVAGGWLADDDWDHYEFGGLAKTYERGESWIKLMIMPVAADHGLEAAA
jgi:hypothetical protein